MTSYKAIQRTAEEHGLSRREREVLTLAAQGLHSRDIGRRLGIGDSTVRSHLASLAHKPGVRSAVQLGAHAVEIGLLRPEERHDN